MLSSVSELESQEIKSPSGKDRWNKRTIELMLGNEKYAGNVLVGKTFCNEYQNNRRFVNNGERAKYLAEGNHPAIISEELFERVKAEKERRSNIQIDDGVAKRKSTHYSMKKAVKSSE